MPPKRRFNRRVALGFGAAGISAIAIPQFANANTEDTPAPRPGRLRTQFTPDTKRVLNNPLNGWVLYANPGNNPAEYWR